MHTNTKLVLAAAVGFVGGYYTAKGLLERKYMAIANEEAAAATAFYKAKYANEEPEGLPKENINFGDIDVEVEQEKLDKAVEAAEALQAYQGDVLVTNKLISKTEPSGHTNYMMAMVPVPKPVIPEPRDEDKPFIITDEEFLGADANYEGYTMTYYAGDDVLVSQSDKVVEGEERIICIGPDKDNLRFGHMSNDENIVYIRCHKLQMDFEIARSAGEYSKEVLGL